LLTIYNRYAYSDSFPAEKIDLEALLETSQLQCGKDPEILKYDCEIIESGKYWYLGMALCCNESSRSYNLYFIFLKFSIIQTIHLVLVKKTKLFLKFRKQTYFFKFRKQSYFRKT